ncbi:MAG: hypothetical protein AAGK32_07555 [Actinomycetota bacterium]
MKRGKQLMKIAALCLLGAVGIAALTLTDTVEPSTVIVLVFIILLLLGLLLLPIGLIVALVGRGKRTDGDVVWQPPADPASYGRINPGVSPADPARPPDPPRP